MVTPTHAPTPAPPGTHTRVVASGEYPCSRILCESDRDEGDLSDLDTIGITGLERPIEIEAIKGDKDHDWRVIAGHRRYHKVVKLGLPVIWANVVEGSRIALFFRGMRENIRKNPSPYEWAKMIHSPELKGVTVAEIATQTGFSKPYLYNLQRIWADPTLRARLKAGESTTALLSDLGRGKKGPSWRSAVKKCRKALDKLSPQEREKALALILAGEE